MENSMADSTPGGRSRKQIAVRSFALLLIMVIASNTPAGSQQASGQHEDTAKALDVLLAKDEIREQIYKYCRGLDRMDKTLALSVWHPDATVIAIDGAKLTGPALIESAWRSLERLSAHSHQVTNILIKVEGKRATSESYFITSLRSEPTKESAETRLVRGRYLDRWSMRNGRWAMDFRRVLVDFTTTETSTGPNPAAPGRRDKTDPSYDIYF
jgi:hypothetical protein